MLAVIEFLRAIKDRAKDDSLRLIFADWLEEHGQGERAELIRIQVEGARLSEDDPRWEVLVDRNQELLDKHGAEWLGPFADVLEVWECQFQRGLLHLMVGSRKAVNRLASRIDAGYWAWVEGLHLALAGDRAVPVKARIKMLAILARLTCLTSLNLYGSDIGSGGASALAQLADFEYLTSLNFDCNDIGAEGAAALASSPHLSRLGWLSLINNGIGNEGLFALAASPNLSCLATLQLCGNGVGAQGAIALARSPHLMHLVHLDLGSNEIGDEGACALAKSTRVANLCSLHLYNNKIGEEGALALVNSPYLTRVSELRLYNNSIGRKGVKALRQRFGQVIVGSLE